MTSGACQKEIRFIRVKFRKGHFAEAFQLAAQAARRWPDEREFPKYAGLSAAALKCHDTACTEFERAWLLSPTHTDYALRYGMSLLRCGRPRDVLKMLDIVSDQIPLASPLLHLQAMARVRLGDPQAALKSLLESLSLRPDHAASVALVIDVSEALGQRDIALKAAERLCGLLPRCSTSRARLNSLKQVNA